MRIDELIINKKPSNTEKLSAVEKNVKDFMQTHKLDLDQNKTTQLNAILKKIAEFRNESGAHWQDNAQVDNYLSNVASYMKNLETTMVRK